MRQTAVHRTYGGSRAVSCDCRDTACSGAGRRSGFTLIEVVVATSILLIILVPLMAAFGRGVAGFKTAQLFTFAQNLAEFQAEDIKSMAPSVLNQLVEGTYPGAGLTADNPLVVYSNYPAARKAGDPGYDAASDAAAATNDALNYMYDSGDIATNFNLIGLTKIVGDPYVAGDQSTSAPVLPSGVPMLGPNIEILPYEDVDYTATHWRYYRAVLHKEAYPLFTKRILVTRYDANYLPDKTHHDSSGDVSTLFDYTLTVSTRLSNGTLRTLYTTQGTIGSSFTVTPTTVTVTEPAMGAAWSNSPAVGTVAWTVTGSTSGVFAYRVRFSNDDGISYGAPLAVVLATAPLTVDVDPGVTDSLLLCRIMVEAVNAKGQVLGYDTSGGFTVGTPGGTGGLFFVVVQQPVASSVWTVGQAQTVRWSTSGVPLIPVDQFSVQLSTDGGSSYGPATIAAGNATSAIMTPSVAWTNCVVRVTAQGVGGAPVVGGVADSATFTTLGPLAITVTSPSSSSVWTTGVAGTVTWSLSRSEPSIASYSIRFIGSVPGGPVTVGAGATSASITPGAASESCVVSVSALNGSGGVIVSGNSASFKVRDPFSINVLQPQAGSSHKKNRSITVQWATNGNAAPVASYRISLSVDNGATYGAQTTAAAGAFSATFTLPNSARPQCIVKVEALDASSGVVATGLSGVFVISNS